jgi:hypothetical protein
MSPQQYQQQHQQWAAGMAAAAAHPGTASYQAQWQHYQQQQR